MNERGWMEPIVERVVGQVLESHAAQLRVEIVRRVMEEMAAAPEFAATRPSQPKTAQPVASGEASAGDSATLARALAEIQAGTSQREILRALLNVSSRYAARVALFVVKGSRATGWQARGFADCDAIKDFALEETTPAVVCAIRDRVLTSATAEDLDPRLLEQVGMAASGEVQILPLILKDKVAALLYADSGTEPAGLLDAGSLELLVLSTGAWLEVNSLRKQAQKEPSASQTDGGSAAEELPYRAPAPSAPAFNDPFASHAPSFSSGQAMAAAASGEVSRPAVSEKIEPTAPAAWGVIAEVRSAPDTTASAAVETQSAHAGAAAPARASFTSAATGTASVEHPSSNPATIEAATATPAALSPEDQEVHRKAQRFARLLVDEIKLYNQAKVTEGRNNKDLYDRLKEVIEKSRITYQKRYGATVAASGNYFQHEIIRSLAEDDLSIMGANFRH